MAELPYEDVLLVSFDASASVNWANRYDVQGSRDEGNAVTLDYPPNPHQKGATLVVAGQARTNMLAGGPMYNADGLLLRANLKNGNPQTSEVFGGPIDEKE